MVSPQAAEATPQYTVSVAYVDTIRAGGVLPTPWQGSPNVDFVGNAGSGWDSGAIEIQNDQASDFTADDVTVRIGSETFDLWGSGLDVPVGGSLILAQTSGENFDTSDQQSCTPDGLFPEIGITIGGVQSWYQDGTQVLNTGGVDKSSCDNNGNESEPNWDFASAVPSTTTLVSAAPNPVYPGAFVDLQANVSASDGTTPAGTVVFSSGGANLGTAQLDLGTASITTTVLPIGDDQVTATFEGSEGYAPSAGSTAETVLDPNSPVPPSSQYGTGNDGGRGPTPCLNGDPIRCSIGNLVEPANDLSIPGRGLGLSLARTYNAMAAAAASSPGAFGWGWSFNYGASLSVDSTTGNVTVTQGDGATAVFSPNGSGGYVTNGALSPIVNATLVHNSDGSWTLTQTNQDHYNFSSSGQLTSVSDRNGEITDLVYNPSGQLATVTDPAGRSLNFTYDTSGQVATVTDPTGRIVSYAYDSSGNLTSVTDPAGDTTTYGYDASHRLTSKRDPNGGVTSNTYDSSNRVVSQTDPAGRTSTYAYTSEAQGTHTTTITDGNGNVEVQTYSAADYLVSVTKAYGTPAANTWIYTYDGGGDRLMATDPRGNTTHYSYDATGNLTKLVDRLGRIWSYTYDSANDPTTITDPTGQVTTITYTAHDDPTTVTRTLVTTGQPITYGYLYSNSAHPGDLTGITDPNGHTTSFGYDVAGDLTAVTDAAGDKATYNYNGIGWRTSMVSPRGNLNGANPATYTTSYAYDNDGRLTKTTDSLGRSTVYTYDKVGNRLNVTDPSGKTTTYTYNPDNQQTASKNASGATWTSSYDNGTVRFSV